MQENSGGVVWSVYKSRIRSCTGKALIFLIKVYQYCLSPLKSRPSCRFIPTCSEYAVEAIRYYGPVVGVWKGFIRILKCHPFHPGGYDPVVRKE